MRARPHQRGGAAGRSRPGGSARREPVALPPSAGRLLGLVVVFFLALAVAVRPLLPGHRFEGNLWVAMCVFVAAMAWLVRMAMERRLRLVRTGLGLPLLVLLALASISAARSPHPAASVAVLVEWFCYAGLFFVVVNAVAGGLGEGFLLRVLWASAFAVALYGLFQQFIDLPLLTRQIQEDAARTMIELRMSPRHLGDLMARAHGRVFATFLVANSFAGFLALVIPGFAGYALDRLRSGDRSRAFLVAAALWLATALACLLLTFSKGGWMAFAVGAVAFCMMLGRDVLRRQARLLGGIAAGLAAVAGLFLLTGVIPIQIFRDALPSLGVRMGYWRAAGGMAADHLVGGVGLGAFGSYYSQYRAPMARLAQSAHNDYLQVLAELGVFGLGAFVWVWVAWALAARKPAPAPEAPRRQPPAFPFRVGVAAGIVALLLTTVVMGTFALSGWWDAEPGGMELKLWLDRALRLGLAAAWLLFFLAMGRRAAPPPGELARKGLLCGVIAFLVHCAVDFDYYEPGLAFSAWVIAALSVRPRRPAFERALRPAAALAIGLGALVLMGGFQFLLVRVTRSATDREVAASLESNAALADSARRSSSPLKEAEQRYQQAIAAWPIDDGLHVAAGNLAENLLWLPFEAPQSFRRAAELYRQAARIEARPEPAGKRIVDLYRAAAEGFHRAASLFARAAKVPSMADGPYGALAQRARDAHALMLRARDLLGRAAARPAVGPEHAHATRLFRDSADLFRRAADAFARIVDPTRGTDVRRLDFGPPFGDPMPLFRRADAHYARAVRLNRASPGRRARLAQLYLRAADHRLAAALEPLIEPCSARRPPTGPNLAYLPAVAEFEAAARRDPNNPILLIELAEALEKHGDPSAPQKARRALQLGTLLFENDPGHKLCPSYEEAQRAHAIIGRASAKGAVP